MITNPTPGRALNDMRELYAVQHAITDAGGALTPAVHKALDALREVWDARLRKEQEQAYQYRTAPQEVAALTPCTCRQAVHAREHKGRPPVPGCVWCAPTPDIRPNRPTAARTVDLTLPDHTANDNAAPEPGP
jgi:hypothetical protein